MSTTYLQRSAWVAWLLLVLSGIGAASLMLDDKSPFAVLEYRVGAVRPGGVLRIEAAVKRDLSRKCSVQFSRHIFDSQGTRHDISAATMMTFAALQGLEQVTPGRLVLAVHLPPHIALGKAKLVTPLIYQCNVWHAVKPIETTMVVDFEVAP